VAGVEHKGLEAISTTRAAADSLPDGDIRRGTVRTWPGWLLVCGLTLALYAATASRGPQWQDSGQHIMRILDREPVHILGLALSHPLHYWLGRIAVGLDWLAPAFAITLVSSLAAAVGVANVFGIVLRLTGRFTAALWAAASLAIAHTYWQMATVAEVYTLSAAILMGEVWCILLYAETSRRSFLLLAVALNGLALSNHNVALLTTPIWVVLVMLRLARRRLNPGDVVMAAGLWLAGSLPYTALVVSELTGGGALWPTLRSALFGHAYAEEVLNLRISLRLLAHSGGYLALNFPNLTVPIAVYGILAARSRLPVLARRVLYLAALLHGLFVLRYNVVDQYTFFLPAYSLLAVFAGIGFAALADRKGAGAKWVRAAAGLLLPLTVACYAAAPAVARKLELLRGAERFKPYRDDYAYFFAPWSGLEDSARRMADAALRAAGNDGLIAVPDTTSLSAVRYAVLVSDSGVSVHGELVSAEIARASAEGRAVVYVPIRTIDPPPELAEGEWRREGDLLVLDPGADSATQPE
jgi:hypothetical protein